MNTTIPGNLVITLNHLWAMLIIIIAYKLVTSPKITTTCKAFWSFGQSFLSVAVQYLSYCSKQTRRKIRNMGKRMIYTDGREWLDETEKQITE